jgi:hypothetical protein
MSTIKLTFLLLFQLVWLSIHSHLWVIPDIQADPSHKESQMVHSMFFIVIQT